MKKRIISLGLVSLLGLSTLYGCTGDSEQANSKAVEEYVPVNIESIEPRTISEKTTFSGEIIANKEVMITPKIPGKVTKLNVEVGNKVNVGQVLFTVDKEDLQKQVDQAQKSVELAKSNYDRSKEQIAQAGKAVDLAKSNYERSQEQIAQAGKAVDLAKSNYEKAKEQVDNAKANLERTKKLYEAGIVSKSQYEQAELAASDKSLKTLEVQIEQAKLAASDSALDTARIQIEQAELGASDSVLDTARVQVEQAELGYKQALDSLSNTNITSPTSGIVSKVNINQGEMASSAQPSVVILDTSKMYVEIDVPENVISKISVGQSVDVDIPSTGSVGKGKVEIISPAPDERTQLYSIKVLMNDIPDAVKSGMFAKVNLDVNSKQNVIAVKSDAIIEDGIKSYVYITEKNKAIKREVEVGLDSGEYIEITKGVKKGEKVLVKGQNYVEDGTKVKIIGGES